MFVCEPYLSFLNTFVTAFGSQLSLWYVGEAAETIVKAWFYHFSFEHLAPCENVTCLFYKYYFGGCSSELAGLFPFPFSRRGLLVIQIGSMIFLSRILYGVIMHIPTVAFVVLLIIEILHLQNVFMWLVI